MRWTPEYDRIIAESLVECSSNLHSAFELAQRKLMSEHSVLVSRSAVSSRYYRHQKELDELANSIFSTSIKREYQKMHRPWYVKLWGAIQSMLNLNQRL